MSGEPSSDPFSRTAIWVAVGLVVLLAVIVVVLSKILSSGAGTSAAAPTTATAAPRTGPLALVPVDAPDAGSPTCAALVDGLPGELTSGRKTLRRLTLAEPAPPATRAWGDQTGDPVVLRCGLSRPPELTETSKLVDVSGVRWLPVDGDGAVTWYLVDRPVYVALTMPADGGTGALQGISEAIGKALPG